MPGTVPSPWHVISRLISRPYEAVTSISVSQMRRLVTEEFCSLSGFSHLVSCRTEIWTRHVTRQLSYRDSKEWGIISSSVRELGLTLLILQLWLFPASRSHFHSASAGGFYPGSVAIKKQPRFSWKRKNSPLRQKSVDPQDISLVETCLCLSECLAQPLAACLRVFSASLFLPVCCGSVSA